MLIIATGLVEQIDRLVINIGDQFFVSSNLFGALRSPT